MGLSRLENFIKNVRGNILYVSPNDLDSTDSIENRGNSLTRPFKTIQRALIEASRFSYQRGLNNDRFNQTTVVVYPGEHVVDNRPGWIPDGIGAFKLRNGLTSSDFSPWDLSTNYNLDAENNALYKLNSIHGGVIVPRGVSIVGIDLRKTKIRPKYVPNPNDSNIASTAIFRLTGGAYLENFTVLDSDPNSICYTNYTPNIQIPNFSHHKLTCFEYVDGTNGVNIKDTYLTYSSTRTDLDMYYEKVGLVYGTASGREIQPDYPSTGLDIQSKVDEYRIVGPSGQSVGITSIFSGDGLVSTNTITITTSSSIEGLDVDNIVIIDGISDSEYNGRYIVSEKVNSTTFKYIVNNPPLDPLPTVTGSTASIAIDNVTSASPYINNVTLKSVYGMSGLLADGSKSSGFKSILVSQFSGISLQKDENSFVKFNSTSGAYEDTILPGNENLSSDSEAIYKPSYSNYHIKCINESYVQSVSCFAIGFSEQFVTESGGNISLSNCNSNFGSRSLVSSGFRKNSFSADDLGYVTHIIPPKEIDENEVNISFNAIDIQATVGIATTNERLYLYDQKNMDSPPKNNLEGYNLGAKQSDRLYFVTSNGNQEVEYFSRIVMQNSQSSSEKIFQVNRSSAGINSIASDTISFTQAHSLQTGESVRIISQDGSLPDGLDSDSVYFAITDGLSSNQIKLAKTKKDSDANSPLSFNNFGGTLNIVSRVSDKKSGDVGHPIQYDSSLGQWYVKVATATTENQIHSNVIVGLGTTSLGNTSARTFIRRLPDTRNIKDTTYRFRYVIPASSGSLIAKEPIVGSVIQESNTSIGSTVTEVESYFGSGSINNINQIRNFKFIANAWWDGNTAHILAELPHKLSLGSEVEILNVKSGINTAGAQNSGFNRVFSVTGISSAREFRVGLSTNPGAFLNDTTIRNTSLPHFKRKRYDTTYYVQNVERVQEYVNGVQDGVYYLTVLNSSNSPAVSPFTLDSFSQPIQRLYPEIDKDNPISDPKSSISVSVSNPIGKVVIDDVKNSVTKETTEKLIYDANIGVGLTDIVTSVGGTIHQFRTLIDHGLNAVSKVSIASSGSNYGTGVTQNYYSAKLVAIGASTTGKHATARVTVDATGGITDVLIMNGGSGYAIGNQMNVVGIAITSGHVAAVITVDEINDNIGDVVRVVGVTSNTYQQYNDLYRISSVGIGSEKDFFAVSDFSVTGVTTAGIGSLPLLSSAVYLVGKSIGISSINYNSPSGIATVNTKSNHGLKVNNKVRIISGITTMPEFSGDFIIRKNISLNSFTIQMGVGSTTQSTSIGSSMFVLPTGWSSNAGDILEDNENVDGRMVVNYAGITTTLSSSIANASIDQISLTNVNKLNLTIGDYLLIDDEIVRIKSNPSNPLSNPLLVFRAVLGTRSASHSSGTVVRKINPLPIEFRSPSRNVAQSHVWEYVGFGPGNYSTALPERQVRSKTDSEKILSQSLKKDGGINFFDGIDNEGSSYFGNKKINNVSGEEEVFDGPIINENIEINSNPVVFEDKITSTSDDGLEVKNLLLKGDATLSRKYTIGISTPSDLGIPGDIVQYYLPEQGKSSGWIFTSNKEWRKHGSISLSKDSDIYVFDKVGIATTTLSTSSLRIGAASTLFEVDNNGGVGVGTTANSLKLRVQGSAFISGNFTSGGTVSATQFSGDGSGLTNINVSATGWAPVTGTGNTGIYNAALTRVGVGTSVPSVILDVGSPGTGVTDLRVRNQVLFEGQSIFANVRISGILTSTSYRLDSASSNINAGIVTTSTLSVGAGGTAIVTTTLQTVGIGTLTPRAKLDVEGSIRFKTYSENIETVTPSAGNVTIDLQKAQTFNLNVNSVVSQFALINAPSGSTSFTLKVTQDSTGYSVGIATFKNAVGSAITTYWPGGTSPNVTITANRTDIFTFKTFDQGLSLYGIVEGQNFS